MDFYCLHCHLVVTQCDILVQLFLILIIIKGELLSISYLTILSKHCTFSGRLQFWWVAVCVYKDHGRLKCVRGCFFVRHSGKLEERFHIHVCNLTFLWCLYYVNECHKPRSALFCSRRRVPGILPARGSLAPPN